MFTVMLRIDGAGRCPVLVHEGEELMTEEGVRWRLIAQTDDYDEAIWLMTVLHEMVDG